MTDSDRPDGLPEYDGELPELSELERVDVVEVEVLEELVDQWQDRASGINPYTTKSPSYWKGVQNAYGELANELEEVLEHHD